MKMLGGGGRYLISKSFYGGRNPADIPEEDVQILLQMVLLVHSLSTKQNCFSGSPFHKNRENPGRKQKEVLP